MSVLSLWLTQVSCGVSLWLFSDVNVLTVFVVLYFLSCFMALKHVCAKTLLTFILDACRRHRMDHRDCLNLNQNDSVSVTGFDHISEIGWFLVSLFFNNTLL